MIKILKYGEVSMDEIFARVAPAVNVEGRLGAYLRVGDLFAIAFAAAVPLLKWYIPFRRHQKMRQKAATCAVQSAAQITQP